MSLKKLTEVIKEINNSAQNVKNSPTRYKLSLMEDKLTYDTYLFEVLLYNLREDITENTELVSKLNDKLEELYTVVNEIYESLDLYPYILGLSRYEKQELQSLNETVKKLGGIINQELSLIYEACKRNKSKKKYENVKRKMKKKLMESIQENTELNEEVIQKISDYIDSYVILSEFIDRVMFPAGNNKIFENYENYINENTLLDKNEIEKLLNKYEQIKEEFIELVIG